MYHAAGSLGAVACKVIEALQKLCAYATECLLLFLLRRRLRCPCQTDYFYQAGETLYDSAVCQYVQHMSVVMETTKGPCTGSAIGVTMLEATRKKLLALVQDLGGANSGFGQLSAGEAAPGRSSVVCAVSLEVG